VWNTSKPLSGLPVFEAVSRKFCSLGWPDRAASTRGVALRLSPCEGLGAFARKLVPRLFVSGQSNVSVLAADKCK